MPKYRYLVIGWTEHIAPNRSAYRTFCGKSVELASPRRQALDKCDACQAQANAETAE